MVILNSILEIDFILPLSPSFKWIFFLVLRFNNEGSIGGTCTNYCAAQEGGLSCIAAYDDACHGDNMWGWEYDCDYEWYWSSSNKKHNYI